MHRLPPPALNHNPPPEFISQQTRDSSTHGAIRSWTQLLIAGRLNLVCHQIPVGGKDEDVVQRATRPLHSQGLTLTDTSSRKSHQKFPLKPKALCLSTLLLLSFTEKIDCVATTYHYLLVILVQGTRSVFHITTPSPTKHRMVLCLSDDRQQKKNNWKQTFLAHTWHNSKTA